MMKIIFCFIALFLASCASNDLPLTRQEAELRAEAAIAHGLIIRDNREAEIARVLRPNAPLVATTKKQLERLDAVLIDKRAVAKAAASVPYSTWYRQYNQGRIDRAQLEQLCAKEDARNRHLVASQRRRSNAICASIGASIVAHHQRQQVSPYQLPAFRPLSDGIGSLNPDSLGNPYGAGSPYKPDGLLNPFSRYGSKYSNESWTNPYATNAPKIVDENGKYYGRMSVNKYDQDSISNPYGRYGNKYSPDSLNNPYGAGNPYSNKKLYVIPQE